MKKILLLMIFLLISCGPVFAATDDTALPVLSRGHIESIGRLPHRRHLGFQSRSYRYGRPKQAD